MTTITGRCIKLLNILLDAAYPLTAGRIAQKMNISERTVRYDSVVLSNWLEENGVKMQKRPRVGYDIPDKAAARRLAAMSHFDGAESAYYYTAEERVFKIIGLILSREETLLVQDITDHLYVSKTTAMKDLAEVRSWFAARGVDLRNKPNQGIRLQVEEQEWRALVADWVQENVHEKDLSSSLLQMILTDEYDGTRSSEMLKYMDKILTIANFHTIRKGIFSVCERLCIQLSDTSFINLLIHISIAVNRLMYQKEIAMPPERLASLQSQAEFAVVEEVFYPLMQQQGVRLPQSEIGYITLHLLGAQKLKEENDRPRDARVEELIEVVLRHVQRVYHVDLRHNQSLLQGLALHLRPAIFRNEFSIYTPNPLLELVQADYPETYRMCKEAIEEINGRFGMSFDDNEIGFIVVHIEAALKYYRGAANRSTHPNVVLVCASGLGTAKILSANIRSEFPAVRVVAELSAIDLARQDFKEIDLVISTVRLPMPVPRPVVQVSAVPTPKELEQIRLVLRNTALAPVPEIEDLMHLIEENCDIRDHAMLEKQLRRYLESDAASGGVQTSELPRLLAKHTLLRQQVQSWEEAARLSCRVLAKSGAILPAYADSLIEAKNRYGQYSFIGPGLCMPHAVDPENVRRLGLSLLTLREPVMVDAPDGTRQPVGVFLTLAMADTDSHLKALSEVNAIIKFEPDFFQKLVSCTAEAEVLRAIQDMLRFLA